MNKGLRLIVQPPSLADSLGSKRALMNKGLRRGHSASRLVRRVKFQTCPDEQGIKTAGHVQSSACPVPFQTCPDEQGIKTPSTACPHQGQQVPNVP